MKKLLGCFLCVMLLVFGASNVGAAIIDLTDTGDPFIYTGITSGNDSIWKVLVENPTGTGVYEPFLRYQDGKTDEGPKDGIEIGLNTDLKPVPYEDKEPATIWTRSVLFTDLEVVTLTTGDYWAFTIDFNEPANDARFLSFDIYDIYEGSEPDLGNILDLDLLWDSTRSGGDLSGTLGDYTVLTDYTLAGSGSGEADIEFLIPVVESSLPYFYLYIQSGAYVDPFGTPARDWTANAGFEEIRTTGIPSVPEPATMLLLGTGFLGLALFGRQRFKK
jgi:PEP-CTERM motif-containing protein